MAISHEEFAKKRYKEEQKKKAASNTSTSTSKTTGTEKTAFTSNTKKTISHAEFAKKRYEEQQKKLTPTQKWEQQSNHVLSDIQSYYSDWRQDRGEKKKYYNEQIDSLIESADKWKKAYDGNEDALNAIESIVKCLSSGKKLVEDSDKYYSQWDTEDAYRAYLKQQEEYENKWGKYTKEADFAEYAKKGAEIENPKYSKVDGSAYIFGWRPGFEEPGNVVTYSRDNYDTLLLDEKQGVPSMVGRTLYNQMKDEEVELYNYILAKQGKEAAQKYLDDIEESLNARLGATWGENVRNIENPLLRTAATGLYGFTSGMDQFASGARQFFTNEEQDTSAMQFGSQYIQQDLATKDPETGEVQTDKQNLKQMLYGATTTIGNMAPSILLSSLVPVGGAAVGAASMGISAAGNAYKQALDAGYDQGKARTYSLLVGASESVLQYALGGIGKLGGVTEEAILSKVAAVDDVLARFALTGAVKLGGEILEEELQEFLEPLFKTIVFNEKYDAPTAREMFETALMTAISTGVLEGASIYTDTFGANKAYNNQYSGRNAAYEEALAKYLNEGKTEKEAAKLAKEDVSQTFTGDHIHQQLNETASAMASEGLEIDPENKKAKQIQQRLADGKNVSGYSIDLLAQQHEQALRTSDKSKIQKAAVDRLTKLGATEDVESVAAALAKQAAGEKLTKEESDLIYKNRYAPKVAKELDPKNIRSGLLNEAEGYSTEWAEKLDTDRINVEEYSRLVEEAQLDQAGTVSEMESVAENATVTEEISTPEIEEGKAILNIGNQVENVDLDSVNPISAIKNGRMVLRLADGRTVSSESVTHASEDVNNVFSIAQKLAPDTRTANVMVNGFKPGMNAETYIKGIQLVHLYGKLNSPMTELLRSGSAKQLPVAVRDMVYKAGQIAGGKQIAAEQAKLNASKVLANPVQNSGITFNSGNGEVVSFDEYVKEHTFRMNDVQKSGIAAMRLMNSMLGSEYDLFESYINKDGRRVYINDKGKEVHAPNGFYDGKIHVDINAGQFGEGTILYTVAHESTHDIRKWSPAKFKTLANTVIAKYGEAGISVEKLIAAQQEKAARAGRTLDEEAALEEVVADAMQGILKDGKVAELVLELRKKDMSLAERVTAWFTNLLNKFKATVSAYKDYAPDSIEGRMILDMEKSVIEQIEQLYAEGLVDAAEAKGAPIAPGVEGVDVNAEEIKNTANEDGVKNSLRMSTADIQAVQNIGRISVNQFTTADIKATERLARQYWSEMGAKSPFFRAWFGDWRVNDPTMIKVADQPGNSRGVQKNDDTGWDIQVSGKVFTETRVHTDSYNIAARPYLPYINDIVKKAVLLDSFGVDTNKPKSVNSLLVHSLYAVADIGTGPEVIKLYVEEMNNPNADGTNKRAYQLQNIEKYQPTGKSSQKTASSISPVAAGTIRTVADLFADVKQKDGSFNPNPVSAITNADGTPKIMYHGSPAQFTVFDKKKAKSSGLYGRGFYFTDSETHAGTYGQNYSVYLNIRNPLESGKATVTRAQVKAYLEEVADNEDYSIENYGTYDIDTILRNVMGSASKADAFKVIQDINATAIGDMVEAAELFNTVNGTDFDGIVVSTETVAFKPEQIKSATDNIGTFDKNNPDIRYSERDGESVSNRALLANAFEGAVTNDIEKAKLEEYKGTIDRMNAEEQKLQRLNAKIKELSFAKGARDTARIEKLRTEAQKTANRINTYDKQLLRFEASKPLQNVLEREKAKAYARAEKKGKAALKKQREGFEEKSKQMQKELSAKYRERKQELVDKHHEQIAALKEKHTEQRENERDRRNKTAMRGKIRKVIGELDKLLNHGNKKTNVKAGMREFVAGAVSSAEVLFKDEHTDVDMVRDGIGVTLSEEEQLQYDKAREILSKMDKLTESNANALAEKTKLEGQLSYRLSKLKEALHRERIRINEAVVSDALGTLADEYEKLRDSEYAYVKGAFSESVYNYIKLLQRDIGVAKIKDMTLGQLEDLYKAYRMALTTVRDANKAFVASKSVDEIVENLVTEVERRKMPKTKAAAIARNLSNKIGWDYEKLYYALQRIGSNTLTELFTNLANAEDIVMADVKEANAKKMEIIKKYGYNNWNVDQKLNKVFMDTTGKRFQMTLGELMSLYAYSRRAGAWNHIEYGGFVFNKTALTDTDPVTTYKLNKEQCEAITNTLTEEQKHFVEEMQTFLSDTMGAKGNEVSMKLYGVEMFGEKNYFPVHVAGQFMVKAQESQAKAAAGFSSMTNAGFTQAQNKKAKAPFIMESFMDVWADHVNEMSRYHGTVPALEDIRKVMNYSSYSNAYAESVSVQAILENKYGKKAVQYFNDLYQEANSGAITDKLQPPFRKWISKFRKNSVAYSASVLIQQPASIVRAFAMLPMKYFRGKGVLSIPAGVGQAIFNNSAYKKAYGEMLKYAPGVTLSKEIGGFDTASGNSIRTYLLDTGKNIKQKWNTETDLKGRAKTVMDVIDDNPIANLPNVADKIAWVEIWNACKRETAAKNRDLKTNSDAFMKLVGERFTEVIRATQVYDSMFSKSPLLKNKNPYVQMLVNFMNEPNTAANMVENAIRIAARGDGKKAARTITAVAGSTVFTCVLKSIIYAMRDEDEDERYIEKYLGELTNNLISDFTVFNYIPVARDIWSTAQGFDVERTDMAIISDIMSAIIERITLAAKDTDEMTEDELIEFDKKVIKANMSMLDSVCAAFGIPEKNIRREIKAILNTAGMLYKKSGGKASWASIEDSVLEGVKGASPSFMGPKIQSKGDKLYEAIISGDTAYADRLKGTYKDEDAVTSAIRKALGNNESRILKAAELLVAQDYDEGLDLIDEIVDEGKFTWNDVVSAVNTKVNKLTEDESDEETAEKTKSAVDAEAYVNAILSGSSEDIAEVRESILYTKIENGKTEDEAKESLVSDAKEELKGRYIAEEISKPQVLSAMKTIGADKVEETVNKWTCEVATGISYEDQMAKYKAGNTSVSEYGRILTKYGGLSEEKAAETIVEDSKAAYKDGTFDRNKMISILINYGGKDSAKAESTVQYMDYKLSHPDVSVDDAWIDKYNSEVKDSGINLDMYIEYKNQVKSIDGEGKKERRMAVIHSLPISNAQKDALYYSEGWTQSRIHEAPWH